MTEIKKQKEKTHWLQNVNKNYLGHFDLPEGNDVILTIDKAGWQAVKNPKTGVVAEKRIITFKENHKWLKPFICNETNAKVIFKMTGVAFMEDCENKKIKIGIDKTKLMGEEVDCLRVRQIKSVDLEIIKTITINQIEELKAIALNIGFDINIVCNAYKIKDISQLDSKNFEKVKKGLIDKGIKKEEVKNANN